MDNAQQALLAAFVTTESKSLLCCEQGKIIALSESLLSYSQRQASDLIGHELVISADPNSPDQDWRRQTKRQYRQTHLTGFARVRDQTDTFRDLTQITIRPLGKPEQILGYKITFELASEFDRSLPIAAWQNLFSDNLEALCLFDASLNILSTNKQFNKLLGSRPQPTTKLDQLIHIKPSFNDWFLNAQHHSTQAIIDTENGLTTISLSISMVELNERPLFLASIHDIGTYLATLQNSQQHAQQFTSLLNDKRLAIGFTSMQGIFLEANDRLAEILGVHSSEIIGKHYSHFNTANSYELPERGALELTNKGYCSPFEKHLRHANGSTIRVRVQLLGQFDDHGMYLGTWNFIHVLESSDNSLSLSHHHQALFVDSPDAIALISPEGRFQQVNQAYCKLTGYREEELIGQIATSISAPDSAKRDQEIFQKQLFELGVSERYEKQLLHANGSIIPVSTQSFLIRSDSGRAIGYWSVSRDATSRHDLIKTLAESELRFRSLFSNSIDAIAMCQDDGTIQHANKAFVELTGYSQSELRNLQVQKLSQPHWQHVDQAMARQIAERGHTDIFEKEIYTRAGKSIPVSVRASSMSGKSQSRDGSWMIIRDISQFKDTLQKLQHSQNVLEQTSRMSRVGGWELDISKETFKLTTESFRILSIPETFNTSVRNIAKLLDDKSAHEVTQVVKDVVLHQKRREIELKLSGFEPERWVRVSAQFNKTQDQHFVYGAIQDISDFKLQQQVLESDRDEFQRMAFHDPLTGLPNRMLLQDRTHQIVSQAQRQGLLSCLMILDLDGFKAINDHYGHPAGDKLLKELAQRLQNTVRNSDTVARLGGDEFVVVALISDTQQAEALAKKLLQTIRLPVIYNDVDIACNCSIGISIDTAGQQSSFETLYEKADTELYRIKAGGKGRYGIAQ